MILPYAINLASLKILRDWRKDINGSCFVKNDAKWDLYMKKRDKIEMKRIAQLSPSTFEPVT